MNEKDVFILADEALNDVVDQIRDDQWDTRVPDDMSPRQPGMTLREIINYHAYDDAWVPDVLAGKTIEEVGDKYDGDLLGDHPKLNFASIVETAVLAVRAFDDLDRMVHLTYGDFSVRDYRSTHQLPRPARLRHREVHRRGRDAAAGPRPGALGRDRAEAEAWRTMGVFGPAVEVPEDAPLQDRLLGLTGRQPG